jgi:hypothetical protein
MHLSSFPCPKAGKEKLLCLRREYFVWMRAQNELIYFSNDYIQFFEFLIRFPSGKQT